MRFFKLTHGGLQPRFGAGSSLDARAPWSYAARMTAPEIIDALSFADEETTLEALDAADAQRVALTPRLIEALEQAATRKADAAEETVELAGYALYLLAKWREKSAAPALLKLFSLPDTEALELLGDIPIEDGPILLASICAPDALRTLFENPRPHDGIRASALIALGVLTEWNEWPRADLSNYLTKVLRGEVPAKPIGYLVGEAALLVAYLEFPELLGPARVALRKWKDDEDILESEEFEGFLAETDGLRREKFRAENRPIEDVAAAIAWWGEEDDEDDEESERAAPYVAPNVPSRNAPCPCGSGKKYKNCCAP